MSMAMVSRRVVGYTKGKRKSTKPEPPQRLGRDEMVGEPARHFAPLAAHVPAQPETVNWLRKPWIKGMALLAGTVTCFGLGYLIFKATTDPRPAAPARIERQSARTTSIYEAEPVFHRPGRVTVSAGGQDIGPNPALTERATLTDKSFLATAYVRKKVSLPNISGDCVVTGNGSLDVGECLRRQAE